MSPDVKLRSGMVIAAFVFGSVASAQYQMTALASNAAVPSAPAAKMDPNLVNGWGISRASTSPWWVSDAGTGKSTLYDASGSPQPLVVTVPGASGRGAPTGTMFNGSNDFPIAPGMPAKFLFVSLDGTISGWNPKVDPANAKIVVTTPGAEYTGATIALLNGKQYLYAADFHNGQIDVFDANFQPATLLDADGDDGSPFNVDQEAVTGLAPFNIQNIGGNLFVAFAKQDDAKKADVAGPGNGTVAVFGPGGRRLQTLERVNDLNSPWGMALAPGDFGVFSHHLLVGQFRGGEILAYNLLTGQSDGPLLDPTGKPLVIDGLWGIGFGSGIATTTTAMPPTTTLPNGPANALFFAAGPGQQQNGLFGMVTPVATALTQGNGN